jgi:hypothetical protein
MPTKPGATGFVWNDKSHRWRDTSTGRYISQTRMNNMRDAYLDSKKMQTGELIDRLYRGEITSNQWALEMRQLVKETYINEYLAAHGGVESMTQADWGRLGHMLRDQYAYLDKFQADLNAGKMTAGQAKVRAGMYIESASQAFEKGKADARGVLSLPAYPGDGQTVCKANCRCHWQIAETDTGWDCTWVLGQAEHCPDCVDNAAKWSPLEVSKAA